MASDLKTKEAVLEWAYAVGYDIGLPGALELFTTDATRIADAVKLAEDPRMKKALRLLTAWEMNESALRNEAGDWLHQCVDGLAAALDESEET